MEGESARSLFLCMCAEVCSWLGDWPLSLPPHLSVHLSIPSSRSGCTTMARNICGNQVITAEPKQRAVLLTSSGTPQLALHLHLPSLWCSPDDQRIISLKRPGRQRSVERKIDRWVVSGDSMAVALWKKSPSDQVVSYSDLCIVLHSLGFKWLSIMSCNV